MAEWSKALRSGRSPHLVGVGSNPTSDTFSFFAVFSYRKMAAKNSLRAVYHGELRSFIEILKIVTDSWLNVKHFCISYVSLMTAISFF